MCLCRVLTDAKEGVKFPDTGDPGGCEAFDIVAGNPSLQEW